MGFSNSSLDALIKKGYVEKYDAEIDRDPFADRVFEQEVKQKLTIEQQHAFDTVKTTLDGDEARTFYYMASLVQEKPKSTYKLLKQF